MIAHRQCGLGAVLPLAALATLAGATAAVGQAGHAGQGPDRVLAFPPPVGEERLDVDRGAMGAWHRIRKLATTASLLHITAHPDDEHAGMLTLASRGWGARTALLSLNRGEAGANAIGPELFDGLGLIRTRELVLSGRYYGLDDLYFTTAVDYGYSKSVDEAFRSWDREAVLEDMVRVIRLNRPLVVVSRFHGSARDGHGHHHAAGLLTPEAVAAAADPTRFPRQIAEEGLRPWRVLRTFRGGLRVDEPHDVEVNATGMSPWLGDTYQRWASRGLGLQRSQTAGRVRTGGGRYLYGRLDGTGDGAEATAGVAVSFFKGLDTTLKGLPALLDEPASPEADSLLAELDRLIGAVAENFDFRDPERAVADLARGLGWVRAAVAALPDAPETRFHLALKERQFEDAILAASGTTVSAELAGGPAGLGEAVLTPGQPAAIRLRVEPPDSAEEDALTTWVESRGGETLASSNGGGRLPAGSTEPLEVRVPATPAAPYFGRGDVSENHYQVSDSADLHLPWRQPALAAGVELAIGGQTIAHTVPVTAPVSRLPYGSVTRRVETLPALSVSLAPGVGIVPVDGAGGDIGSPGEPAAASMEVRARVVANAAPLSATVRLELPAGWTTVPGAPGVVEHDFVSPGEILDAAFLIAPPAGWRGEAEIAAVARARGTDHRRGYATIEHRDLPLARLWRPARTTVRSVGVARLDGVRIGYVMGVGDEVPAGIEALGATVELLDEAALAELDPAADTGSDEAGFHAIVVGTRAYAVREDLVEYNPRLLEYARGGGHLIVLYQTQEYVPSAMAPYPASLPRGAEEVSEEDAPVRLLRPDHPYMAAPNRIAEADFDGWIEQRGSKFFSDWDPAYTPLVETHDAGQAPQEGVWLTAPVGEGRYTYLALALHRQLPYGVPGAYRILSNVLTPRGASAPSPDGAR